MTKGRDTRQKEGKRKPAKTLMEKRADKTAKRNGTFKTAGTIGGLKKGKS